MDTRDLVKTIQSDVAYETKAMRKMLPVALAERVLSRRHGAKQFRMFSKRLVLGSDIRGLLSGGFGPLG